LEDDEFNGDPYSGQSYYSTSAGTHGAYVQPPMAHGQWDPYNATSYSDHPAGMSMGPAAYPMQDTRRFSAGTGTTSGMAGFGVAAAARGGSGGGPNAGYYGGPRSTGHEDTGPYGYPQPQLQPAEHYDSYGQGQHPAAMGATGAGTGQHAPISDEKYDDAYGGEAGDYDDPTAAQQPQEPAYPPEIHRQDSSGTYHDDEHEMQTRTLKVHVNLLFRPVLLSLSLELANGSFCFRSRTSNIISTCLLFMVFEVRTRCCSTSSPSLPFPFPNVRRLYLLWIVWTWPPFCNHRPCVDILSA
jgi:hypothetical protein